MFGKNKKARNSKLLRIGGYSVVTSIVVIAIVVIVNVLASSLPTSYTQLDTSSQKLYTLSEQTESVVSSLTDDVNVYWIVRDGQELTYIEHLLDKYEALSSHIKVSKIDPDVNPTFSTQYTESVSDNSLVVEYGTNSRYIDYSDIFVTDYTSYYMTGSASYSFAGESELTSAIDYVVKSDLPKIYTISGHGESELSESLTEAIEKQNYTLSSVNLLEEGAIPDDADEIIINNPTSDISANDSEVILDYLENGGKMLLITSPSQDASFTNLEALMENYGVYAAKGIVIEGDENYYAMGYPYYLLPSIQSHDITDSISSNGYRILLTLAQGLTTDATLKDSLTIDTLLTTSDSAYSKVSGYNLQTFDKEDDDIDGPFATAVAVTDELSDGNSTQIVWCSSASIASDDVNQLVSGANTDFILNSISWMCGSETGSISIGAKSLSSETLTIPTATATLLKALVIVLIPAAYLAFGITVCVRRRRK